MKALGVGCLWQLGHNLVDLGLLWIVEGVLKCLEGFFLRETGAARQSLKSVPWIPSWNSCSGVTPKTPRGRPPTVWTSVWIILNLFHDLSWSFMHFDARFEILFISWLQWFQMFQSWFESYKIKRGRVVEHPSLFLELHAGNAIGLVEFGGWAQI